MGREGKEGERERERERERELRKSMLSEQLDDNDDLFATQFHWFTMLLLSPVGGA